MPRKGQVENLVGNKYGRLTVVSRADDHIHPSGNRKTMWNCLCECGNFKVVGGSDLKSGHTSSCGCNRGGPPRINLLNHRFGRLHVIKRDVDKILSDGTIRTMWKCECDCGNIISVYTGDLKTGNTLSCGCLRKDRTSGENNFNFKDLTGNVYGKLTVTSNHVSVRRGKRSRVLWECHCSCGCSKFVCSTDLIHGYTTSCGNCKHESHNFDDLTGQIFSNWTVTDDYKIECGKTKWKCICSCGASRYVWAASLKNGASKSCGCIKSLSEQYCLNLIHQENFKYTTQLKFDDLTGIGNGKLSYDFGLFDDSNNLICLIECQGRQLRGQTF